MCDAVQLVHSDHGIRTHVCWSFLIDGIKV